jgi:hypothetical protein
MGTIVRAAALAALMLATGCAATDRYPMSRAKAAPGDPVQSLHAPLLPETLYHNG